MVPHRWERTKAVLRVFLEHLEKNVTTMIIGAGIHEKYDARPVQKILSYFVDVKNRWEDQRILIDHSCQLRVFICVPWRLDRKW